MKLEDNIDLFEGCWSTGSLPQKNGVFMLRVRDDAHDGYAYQIVYSGYSKGAQKYLYAITDVYGNVSEVEETETKESNTDWIWLQTDNYYEGA